MTITLQLQRLHKYPLCALFIAQSFLLPILKGGEPQIEEHYVLYKDLPDHLKKLANQSVTFLELTEVKSLLEGHKHTFYLLFSDERKIPKLLEPFYDFLEDIPLNGLLDKDNEKIEKKDLSGVTKERFNVFFYQGLNPKEDEDSYVSWGKGKKKVKKDEIKFLPITLIEPKDIPKKASYSILLTEADVKEAYDLFDLPESEEEIKNVLKKNPAMHRAILARAISKKLRQEGSPSIEYTIKNLTTAKDKKTLQVQLEKFNPKLSHEKIQFLSFTDLVDLKKHTKFIVCCFDHFQLEKPSDTPSHAYPYYILFQTKIKDDATPYIHYVLGKNEARIIQALNPAGQRIEQKNKTLKLRNLSSDEFESIEAFQEGFQKKIRINKKAEESQLLFQWQGKIGRLPVKNLTKEEGKFLLFHITIPNHMSGDKSFGYVYIQKSDIQKEYHQLFEGELKAEEIDSMREKRFWALVSRALSKKVRRKGAVKNKHEQKWKIESFERSVRDSKLINITLKEGSYNSFSLLDKYLLLDSKEQNRIDIFLGVVGILSLYTILQSSVKWILKAQRRKKPKNKKKNSIGRTINSPRKGRPRSRRSLSKTIL